MPVKQLDDIGTPPIGLQAGRVTLENAIRQVEGHPEWRARVVYGDTDSLFVLLPGRSRAEAFRIG
jgi:DNA polymerase zeta